MAFYNLKKKPALTTKEGETETTFLNNRLIGSKGLYTAD